MGKRKIVIDVNRPESIDEAVRKYDEILREFDEKMERFMQEIAQVGADAAFEGYEGAVTVTANQIGPDEWVIRGNHEAIVFFEFGAGKATLSEGDRYAGEMEFPVHRGSYSEANEGEYAASGYVHWHFGGREYTEVRQRPGMLRAYEAIIQEIPNVAKKVFG
jgi:hypothetical protein